MAIDPRQHTLTRSVVPVGYTVSHTGEAVASGSPVRLPDVPAQVYQLRAKNSNSGSVYFGFSPDANADGAARLTLPQGTNNVNCGFELQPGESTGWMLGRDSLKRVHIVSAVANDGITWIAMG